MRPADHPNLVLVVGWTTAAVIMAAILAIQLDRF